MDALFLTWDDNKDRENLRKHGVSFREASTVFTDENARLIYDPDHSEDEDRFILLGFSARARLGSSSSSILIGRMARNSALSLLEKRKNTNANSMGASYEKTIRLLQVREESLR